MKFLRKKSVSFIVSLLAIGFSFLACDDDTEIDEYESVRGIQFPDYELFTEKKNAWTEPAYCSFSYLFECGSSIPVMKVRVENGVITVEDDELQNERMGKFSSISEIYDYFDSAYKNCTLGGNCIGVSFSACFDENCGYPYELSSISHYEEPVGGGGCIFIKIFDVKIE